jgi:hypothetical protein
MAVARSAGCTTSTTTADTGPTAAVTIAPSKQDQEKPDHSRTDGNERRREQAGGEHRQRGHHQQSRPAAPHRGAVRNVGEPIMPAIPARMTSAVAAAARSTGMPYARAQLAGQPGADRRDDHHLDGAARELLTARAARLQERSCQPWAAPAAAAARLQTVPMTAIARTRLHEQSGRWTCNVGRPCSTSGRSQPGHTRRPPDGAGTGRAALLGEHPVQRRDRGGAVPVGDTVKTHQRMIYRKLGAAGRRDAVRRAKQLRLL